MAWQLHVNVKAARDEGRHARLVGDPDVCSEHACYETDEARTAAEFQHVLSVQRAPPGDVGGEDLGVVVRRRVCGDELGAGVEEELLESRDALLTAGVKMSRGRGDGCRRAPELTLGTSWRTARRNAP